MYMYDLLNKCVGHIERKRVFELLTKIAFKTTRITWVQ